MIDNVFHQHLEHCRQCREHPFQPCQAGARLLRAAAENARASLLNTDLARRIVGHAEPDRGTS